MSDNANDAADWRRLSQAPFACEKSPVASDQGMIVTNHPLASAAGAEMLAARRALSDWADWAGTLGAARETRPNLPEGEET